MTDVGRGRFTVRLYRQKRGNIKRIEKIETAVEPLFQQHFVEAMALPHKTADFANLKKVVTLPPHKDVVTLGDDGGARRVRRRG